MIDCIHLVDVVVDLVGHLFELVVRHAEVPLVRVQVSVLPPAPGLLFLHVGGQIEGSLESLEAGGENIKTDIFLVSLRKEAIN